MTIVVNGQQETVDAPCTVARLLHTRGSSRGVAVAVNDAFVPRAQYDTRELRDGDVVEIVAPMQGG